MRRTIRQEAADKRQQTRGSRQEEADKRKQTRGSRQEEADKRKQTRGRRTLSLYCFLHLVRIPDNAACYDQRRNSEQRIV
jgi:hypothetical protein